MGAEHPSRVAWEAARRRDPEMSRDVSGCLFSSIDQTTRAASTGTVITSRVTPSSSEISTRSASSPTSWTVPLLPASQGPTRRRSSMTSSSPITPSRIAGRAGSSPRISSRRNVGGHERRPIGLAGYEPTRHDPARLAVRTCDLELHLVSRSPGRPGANNGDRVARHVLKDLLAGGRPVLPAEPQR